MKNDFIRKVIKEELNFETRKYKEFIQISSDILESTTLKDKLKEIKESQKNQIIKEITYENNQAIQNKIFKNLESFKIERLNQDVFGLQADLEFERLV